MAPVRGGLYRPREPCASPLWQCAMRHGNELRAAGRLRRAVEEQVIERFIECGDPHHGFARIWRMTSEFLTLCCHICMLRHTYPSTINEIAAVVRYVLTRCAVKKEV